jgi:hypothetical protein
MPNPLPVDPEISHDKPRVSPNEEMQWAPTFKSFPVFSVEGLSLIVA